MKFSATLCLVLAFAGLHSVRGDTKQYCKFLAPKHCDNDNVRSSCSAECGNSGGSQTQPPQDTSSQAPTTQQSGDTTTKSSDNHCDGMSPCIPKPDANAHFKDRCSKLTWTNKGCIDHCNYDENANSLKGAFMKGPCKVSELRPYLKCASNDKDNRDCCKSKDVGSFKGGLCLPFCNPSGEFWPDKNQALKYAPCLGVLTQIMNCHYYQEGTS